MQLRLGAAAVVLGWSAFASAQPQPQPPAASTTEDKLPAVLSQEGYSLPPKIIENAVRAPWHNNGQAGLFDPHNGRWLRVVSAGPAQIADLARPHLNLAGLEIDPAANRSRDWTQRRNSGIVVKALNGAPDIALNIPAGVSPVSPDWSPDGRHIAFVGNTDTESALYVADPRSGSVRRLTSRPLLATLETSFFWKSDSSAVLAVLIPKDRPGLPVGVRESVLPSVRVADRFNNRIRTFADRLENPAEAAMLKHYATGQLAVVELGGKVTEIGKPGLIQDVDPAPDFHAFEVTTMLEPFLYTYPVSSFLRRTALWDKEGKELSELSATRLPDAPPAPPKPDDRRSIQWAPDGKGLIFFQRGPADKDNKRKDRIMRWTAPYGKDDAKVLWETDGDLGSVLFFAGMDQALLTRPQGQETVVSIVELRPGGEPRAFFRYKSGEFYENPGSISTMAGPAAGSVVRVSEDGKSIFMTGIQYDRNWQEKAPRPFIDRVALADGKKERVWQSQESLFETARILDRNAETLVVSRQSRTAIPNDFLVDLAGKKESQITANVDYLPDVSGLRMERRLITRSDGFKFWATVTLPRFALNGRERKAFFWFYPNEVADQKTYDEGQRTENINLFRRAAPSSVNLFALLGYVVVEPDLPIVGARERPNDGYVPQLRNSLYAVIDQLDREGLIDRRYLAIGGHSYGAFSTANAMIHTPFFKAGLAGSGNYNRTLTPFGFQAEPRRLWESREVYLNMSPILYAEQITGALLMTHGAEDQNVGTFPINSYRLFDALESLGKPAALYVYPHEDHGQIAIETRLDMWARWIAWLEHYVK